ncbi:ncair mutase [Campylobacter sputorum subsp. bubulus]|uniref:Ncair mutase n=1 Tax=Campylobacter sputorum subsp. sputorum TaxID=32024 RepID=A0A381DGT9_9BACT|nr:nickel pincer cofactor biosynthesis protein LarB [Campylobacter sputorum]ASM34958.1 NCAIR mutase (PurE)-related protein [Campylobacter sputorum aubsp. sputorum RM3237]KAB0581913.1 nickel pincer cofactor biosynthesis protein LarB [Campylobacter sputorum subsp. sputorum]QEL05149.1 NCAIR mutase (PurE)-related protein [Campylobacter sputorum subsp. sputorum]SUX09492.1 ncair mutase [Campylobacter sputorum subsp. sputorum]SUX30783.1 ncair mutase [Campylobacter sputorum subsp. bubulus]
MNKEKILKLINDIKNDNISSDEVIKILKNYPFHDIGCAKIDKQRVLRNGNSEIIYGAQKTKDEILAITKNMNDENILITRSNVEVFNELKNHHKNIKFNDRGKIITIINKEIKQTKSYIAIVSAGASDSFVVEEAYETAIFLGNKAIKIIDVGVAGINRLFLKLDEIQKAKVLIVVAGMEGALPSVIAGLVNSPIIAVPTSVGYGANFRGISALLSMLNSCSNGISVVNIDNGFGAAYNASIINHM